MSETLSTSTSSHPGEYPQNSWRSSSAHPPSTPPAATPPTAVRKGTRVAEYTGPRLSKNEADAANEESPITYLFGLGDGSIVIDGHCMAMFINHSCNPNCETEEIKGRVWIKAIRKIEPGEEITYDYCLYDGGDDEAICNCGAGNAVAPCTRRRRYADAKP